MGALILKGVSKSFGSTLAVSQTDLTFAKGELTALLGPSGCGKTTLLRMIAGLEEASRGDIFLDGEKITNRPAHERKFGMVFQSFALFPHYSVRENVAYSLTIGGVDKARAFERAEALLETVQLAGYGDRRIGALSGGQRQRVAIARALAQEPDVFLLDEPMSALDAKLREEMQVELRLLQQRLGITTIVVTHDQREAMTMADKIVVMSNGRVEQVAKPQEIYHQPANAFVADFIGKANFFDGVYEAGAVRVGQVTLTAEGPFRPGSPVKLAIRPERASIEHKDPAGGPNPESGAEPGSDPGAEPGADLGANRLPARVMFVRDLGPLREYHLQSEIGPMVVEYAAGESGPTLATGDSTHVRLPPEALQIFPRSEPRAA